MPDIIVDSNVILDILEDDPEWYEWSVNILNEYSGYYKLCINDIIYTEISIGFDKIEDLENVIYACNLIHISMPKEALFLAGKAFLKYRKTEGNKKRPHPDFFIGAHAAVSGLDLITRDVKRINCYFPGVKTVSP